MPLSKETIRALKDEIDRLEKSKTPLDAEIKELRSKIKNIKDDIDQKQAQYDDIDARIKALKKDSE